LWILWQGGKVRGGGGQIKKQRFLWEGYVSLRPGTRQVTTILEGKSAMKQKIPLGNRNQVEEASLEKKGLKCRRRWIAGRTRGKK